MPFPALKSRHGSFGLMSELGQKPKYSVRASHPHVFELGSKSGSKKKGPGRSGLDPLFTIRRRLRAIQALSDYGKADTGSVKPELMQPSAHLLLL
jgi:hypothetical protein